MLAWFVFIAIIVGISFYVHRIKSEPLEQLHGSNSMGWLNLVPEEFVVVDFETSGLDSSKHQIIEFGAILVHRSQLLEDSPSLKTFQSLVKAKRKLSKKIVELTGIDDDLLAREGGDLADVLKDFMEFIGERPLVAYNAPFDQKFLIAAAEQHGFNVKNRWICALKKARSTWPGRESYKLGDLTKSIKSNDAHRALADAQRALIVYSAAMKQ